MTTRRIMLLLGVGLIVGVVWWWRRPREPERLSAEALGHIVRHLGRTGWDDAA